MSKIPQSEVRESDFGDLATADQSALSEAAEKSRALAHYSAQAAKASEMFKDAPRAGYEVSKRVQHDDDVTRYVIANQWAEVTICSVSRGGLTASLKLTQDEAEALGLELIAAAVEARIAVSREAA